MPLEKSFKISEYIKKTENWTGADIESVCRNAGINAIKRVYQLKQKIKLTIKKQDFENALTEISKQIGQIVETKEQEIEKIKNKIISKKKKTKKKF